MTQRMITANKEKGFARPNSYYYANSDLRRQRGGSPQNTTFNPLIMSPTILQAIFNEKNSSTIEKYDLKNVYFSDGVSFSNLTFENVDLTGCHLVGCDFRNCEFANVKLDNVVAPFADFSGSVFDNCSMSGADFFKAKFSDSTFNNVDARYSNFENAFMQYMREMKNSNFLGASLNGTNFDGSSIENCSFINAIFGYSNIDLAYPDILNQNEVKIENCMFDGAIMPEQLGIAISDNDLHLTEHIQDSMPDFFISDVKKIYGEISRKYSGIFEVFEHPMAHIWFELPIYLEQKRNVSTAPFEENILKKAPIYDELIEKLVVIMNEYRGLMDKYDHKKNSYSRWSVVCLKKILKEIDKVIFQTAMKIFKMENADNESKTENRETVCGKSCPHTMRGRYETKKFSEEELENPQDYGLYVDRSIGYESESDGLDMRKQDMRYDLSLYNVMSFLYLKTNPLFDANR